jgi:hypothetical protein
VSCILLFRDYETSYLVESERPNSGCCFICSKYTISDSCTNNNKGNIVSCILLFRDYETSYLVESERPNSGCPFEVGTSEVC